MYHDFKPGAQQNTGNPLDLAIGDSESFFCVQSPQGETLYSRNGSFFLNAQNQIVTQGGYPLLGEAGPIAVPAGTARIHVATDGSVSADGNPIGRVQLNRFANLKGLTAVGPTLYSASPEAGRKTVVGTVIQGSRESSNVNPAEAMVQLIIGARYYDAAQRALRSIAETIQLNTRPQG
jgi:flagellar basal body rod protein FlgG